MTEENAQDQSRTYRVEAESPHSDDLVGFETGRESRALWWLEMRDATVTESGSIVDGKTLWDRFGGSKTTEQTTLVSATDTEQEGSA